MSDHPQEPNDAKALNDKAAVTTVSIDGEPYSSWGVYGSRILIPALKELEKRHPTVKFDSGGAVFLHILRVGQGDELYHSYDFGFNVTSHREGFETLSETERREIIEGINKQIRPDVVSILKNLLLASANVKGLDDDSNSFPSAYYEFSVATNLPVIDTNQSDCIGPLMIGDIPEGTTGSQLTAEFAKAYEAVMARMYEFMTQDDSTSLKPTEQFNSDLVTIVYPPASSSGETAT